MDPEHLDEQALKFELSIRELEFSSTAKAKRELKQRLREERDDPRKRPMPANRNAADEVLEVSEYFASLLELSSLWSDKRKLYFEETYSMLCHAERRFSYVNKVELIDETTKFHYDSTMAGLDKFRSNWYKERTPYVIVEAKTDSTQFSEADQKELERVQQVVEALEHKKAKTTTCDYNNTQISDKEEEESDEEDVNQVLEEQVEGNQQQIQQNVNTSDIQEQGSSSEVGNGPLPPLNSSPMNAPRVQIPVFPSNPFPNSSAQRIVGHGLLENFCGLPVNKWNFKIGGGPDESSIPFIKDVDLRRGICFLLNDKAVNWNHVYPLNSWHNVNLSAGTAREWKPGIKTTVLNSNCNEVERFNGRKLEIFDSKDIKVE